MFQVSKLLGTNGWGFSGQGSNTVRGRMASSTYHDDALQPVGEQVAQDVRLLVQAPAAAKNNPKEIIAVELLKRDSCDNIHCQGFLKRVLMKVSFSQILAYPQRNAQKNNIKTINIFSICVSPLIFTPFSNPRVGAFLESFMKEVITGIPRKREPPIFDFDLTKQRQR